MTLKEIEQKYYRARGTVEEYLQGTERWEKAREEYFRDLEKYIENTDEDRAGEAFRNK